MVDLHWFGPRPATQLVIYVHGFAVDWTSKGLFTDLAEHLATQKLTSVLFDLSDYDQKGNATYLPLVNQQQRLQLVTETITKAEPTAQINIIAHSMGCGVVASMSDAWLAAFNKVVFLAPGSDKAGSRIKHHILERPDATTEADKISFVRSNGKLNSFSETYVQQFDISFSDLYKQQWPTLKHLKVILAASDKYQPTLKELFNRYKATTIDDSDHNFSAGSRRDLIRLSGQIFGESLPSVY